LAIAAITCPTACSCRYQQRTRLAPCLHHDAAAVADEHVHASRIGWTWIRCRSARQPRICLLCWRAPAAARNAALRHRSSATRRRTWIVRPRRSMLAASAPPLLRELARVGLLAEQVVRHDARRAADLFAVVARIQPRANPRAGA
jgi:hypothetical protein